MLLSVTSIKDWQVSRNRISLLLLMYDRETISVKSHRITALAHVHILLLIAKLSIMHFLTRNIPEISLYLPHNLDCTFFAGFSVCGFFPTSRRSSLLKENHIHSVCWRFTAFLAPSGQRAIGKEFKMCGWSGGKKERKKNPNKPNPRKEPTQEQQRQYVYSISFWKKKIIKIWKL